MRYYWVRFLIVVEGMILLVLGGTLVVPLLLKEEVQEGLLMLGGIVLSVPLVFLIIWIFTVVGNWVGQEEVE